MATRYWPVTAETVWDVLDATDTAGLWAAKPHFAPMPDGTAIDGITLMPPNVPARVVAYFGDRIVRSAAGTWSVERAAEQQAGAR